MQNCFIFALFVFFACMNPHVSTWLKIIGFNFSLLLFFCRVLHRTGQGYDPARLQHQQHDWPGAIHAAGPALAATGRQAHTVERPYPRSIRSPLYAYAKHSHTRSASDISVTLCSFLHQLAKNGNTQRPAPPPQTLWIFTRGEAARTARLVRASLTLHRPAHIIGLFR